MAQSGSLTRSGMINGLNKIINGWLSLDIWCHLYLVGAPPPDETTVISQWLANEAHFIGYAPQRLTTWAAPTLVTPNGGLNYYGMTTSDCAFPVNDPSGSGQLFGYFLTDSTATLLFDVTAWPLLTPISIPQGESFNLTVEYFLFSYFPYPPVGPP